MVKPLNEFGGWLTFFYITLCLRLILSLGVALLSLVEILGIRRITSLPFVLKCVYFASGFFLSVVIINILRIIKKIDVITPDKTLLLINIYLFFIIISYGVQILVSNLIHYPTVTFNGGFDIAWGAIFFIYLMKSERVKAYYGKNSTVEDMRKISINSLF